MLHLPASPLPKILLSRERLALCDFSWLESQFPIQSVFSTRVEHFPIRQIEATLDKRGIDVGLVD
jgi:hypothetical protein